MGRSKSGRELVEALIAEAEIIVGEHCDPDNVGGFLTQQQKQNACRKLVNLTGEVYVWLRPRVGHVRADDLRDGLWQRLDNLLKYADAETQSDPNKAERRKKQRIDNLRYERDTTDLPLIYGALRDATGCGKQHVPAEDEAPGIRGYRSADWLWHEQGIKQSRLSEAVRDGKVSTRPAPKGTLDSQGRKLQKLYNEAEALKHCSPKCVTKKTRRKLGLDTS